MPEAYIHFVSYKFEQSQYRMVNEELTKNPDNPKAVNGEKREALFSPRFKSVAAKAGWDEEALLMACHVVEQTPDRGHKQKKLPVMQHFVTPPTNSRRKRRAQRTSPASIRVAVIDLDDGDDDAAKQAETEKKKLEQKCTGKGDKERVDTSKNPGSCVSSSDSAIQCIDKLREELSCAICLDICFEPSTTLCGHSFCRKCLQSAADKCGMRCPKCRQVISNGRSCIVNTVLWNSIQLLFPKQVEARKAVGALNNREAQHQSPARIANHTNISRCRTDSGSGNPQQRNSHSMRSQNVRHSGMSSRNGDIISLRRTQRKLPPSQVALRLQREEYTETFRTRRSDEQYRNALALARANLRAMASTAINNIRVRGRGT
ncbi:putative E3 ubiquitin-protein ligase RING1a isoform X1 [Capsicum annuum]|uniref:putative E3 ubiquitin-protein ligase RING1a isoform X1 n=1 Tax=Capsicum annuum TaxID=4072 RepID=UPI001FB056EA|nr:putative E3 ubiquitin-protein ligase RING1a isoform X1 [Capsicum annuum]